MGPTTIERSHQIHTKVDEKTNELTWYLPVVYVPSWKHHILPTEFHGLQASELGPSGTALGCHQWVLYLLEVVFELSFSSPMCQCSICKAAEDICHLSRKEETQNLIPTNPAKDAFVFSIAITEQI